MKATLVAVALCLPLAAAAAETQSPIVVTSSQGFHTSLYQRYCDKLQVSAEAYVHFVKRLKPIYSYTFNDFAPEYPGAPVKADCRVGAQRVAEVHELLKLAAATPAQR